MHECIRLSHKVDRFIDRVHRDSTIGTFSWDVVVSTVLYQVFITENWKPKSKRKNVNLYTKRNVSLKKKYVDLNRMIFAIWMLWVIDWIMFCLVYELIMTRWQGPF